MSAASDQIDAIIASAIETANTFTGQADSAADKVLSLSGGRSYSSGYKVFSPEISAVEPDVPTVTDTTLTYDAEMRKVVKLLSDELASFFNRYYPLTSDAFDEANSWLIDTITNGGTGIPEEIEAQIWQRGRDRILNDGQRVTATITSGYTARGFSLVQGSMIHDLNQAAHEQAGRIGENSTNIAVKQAEIKIETIKFAIGEAIKSRFNAMNAAADYIRSVATSPDAAYKVANINSDAKAKLMSATSDLYRARLSRDQLVIDANTSHMNASVQHENSWLSAIQGKIDGEVRAAAAAADVYAKVAQAALSSLNSVVGSSISSFGE